jgi:1-deoxy-D-xylulose-5-phosphate synthase
MTYTDLFRETLGGMARKDRRIAAVTAAMPGGTGLVEFAKEFPERYFDVGIAEQHGAALASGLACGGIRPVFAVYSTFCQRAYDQVIHDICIQENSVVLCLDRAGLVGEDGWTHHGVFDIAYLRAVPNCLLMAPRDGEEFVRMLQLAVDQTSLAVAIRYPKANVPTLPPARDRVLRPGRAEILREGHGVALHAYGSMVAEAWRAATILEEEGIDVTVVNARFAKPLDGDVLRDLAETHETLITLEEHALPGGFGSAVLEKLSDEGISYSQVIRLGIPDRFQTFGARSRLLSDCGLDSESIAARVRQLAAPRSRLRGQAAVLGNPGKKG